MEAPNKSNSKFHNTNNVLITAKENINYLEFQNYMKGQMSRSSPTFLPNTEFINVCGVHHTDEDGKIGETDSSLLSSFNVTAFGNLVNYCGEEDCQNCQEFLIKECKSSIWKDMNYQKTLIQISSVVSYIRLSYPHSKVNESVSFFSGK